MIHHVVQIPMLPQLLNVTTQIDCDCLSVLDDTEYKLLPNRGAEQGVQFISRHTNGYLLEVLWRNHCVTSVQSSYAYRNDRDK